MERQRKNYYVPIDDHILTIMRCHANIEEPTGLFYTVVYEDAFGNYSADLKTFEQVVEDTKWANPALTSDDYKAIKNL